MGGICWKFTSPSTAGVPDRVVMLHGLVVFVELKRPEGGRLSEMQKARIRQIRNAGVPVSVISTVDEVNALMRRLARYGSQRINKVRIRSFQNAGKF